MNPLEASTNILQHCIPSRDGVRRDYMDIDLPRFHEACYRGDLAAVKSLSATFTAHEARLGKNWALRYACAGGHLAVVIFLVERFKLNVKDIRTNDNQAFRWACGEGHYHVAVWIVNRFGLTDDDARSSNHYALRLACENNHVNVVAWLLKRFHFTMDVARSHNYDIMRHAYVNMHTEIIRILADKFNITPEENLKIVQLSGAVTNESKNMTVSTDDEVTVVTTEVVTTEVVTTEVVTTEVTAVTDAAVTNSTSWWNSLTSLFYYPSVEKPIASTAIAVEAPIAVEPIDVEESSTVTSSLADDTVILTAQA
jgi:hypothetical protein